MKRKDFGELVRALRKEANLNQKQLAQETGLSHITIGKIEDGKQAKLESNILISLANTFELSTVERQQFFLAAMDIESSDISVQKDSEKILEELLGQLAVLRLPAYLIDCHGTIMAANGMWLTLWDIQPIQLHNPGKPAKYNIMRLLCDPDVGMEKIFGNEWSRITRRSMHFFRALTLQHYVESEFQDVLKELKTYPTFAKRWSSRIQDDEDTYAQFDFHEYNHPVHGQLYYAVIASMALTKRGEIYLVTCVPSSLQTQAVFEKLNSTSSGVEIFAPSSSRERASFPSDLVLYPERIIMDHQLKDDNIYYSGEVFVVERILEPDNQDMEGFFKILHETITDDNERETDDEVRRYMREYLDIRHNPDRDYDEIILVAKMASQVVAYTYLNYYPKRRLLFLNYIGSGRHDKSVSEAATKALSRALQHLYLKVIPECKALLYEIDDPEATPDRKEKEHRIARRRLFSSMIRKLGLRDYQLPIDYVQPKVSILEGSNFEEVPMLLMYVPMAEVASKTVLTREEVVSIIETTYLEWYGDIYDTDPQIQAQYMEYLEQLVQRLTHALRDRVSLET